MKRWLIAVRNCWPASHTPAQSLAAPNRHGEFRPLLLDLSGVARGIVLKNEGTCRGEPSETVARPLSCDLGTCWHKFG